MAHAPTPTALRGDTLLLGLGGIVVCLAIGFAVHSSDGPGWAYVPLFFGVVGGAICATQRLGGCPACARAIQVSGVEVAIRCEGCREFLEHEASMLRVAAPGAFRAAPVFTVRLPDGTTPSSVRWPDTPGRCATCGAAAVREVAVPLSLEWVDGMMREKRTYQVPFPACATASHEQPIAWRREGGESSPDGRPHELVSFRSVDLARAFAALNGA